MSNIQDAADSLSALSARLADQPQIENKAEQQDVNIKVEANNTSIGRVALGTAAVLGVLLLAFFVYKSLSVLLLLFMALLVATAIEPIVNKLRRGPFSRSAGILIVYSALFIILGIIGYILVSVFFSQLGDFQSGLAKSILDMQASVASMDDGFLKSQLNSALSVADGFIRKVGAAPANTTDAAEAVAATAVTVVEVFFGLITIFVVAFYWLSERTLVKRSLMSWLPTRRANRIKRVWDEIEVKVGGWVRGQLTLMLLVGLASAVGYFLLGIQFWPALALFIAIAEAIPLVGPYIGTAPAILVALTQTENDGLPALLGMDPIDPLIRALLVVGFAVVLQTIEGNVLIPRIMKNSVGISPLTVIISIILGGTLAGLAGALVAVPLVGALQVIIVDIKTAHESQRKQEEEAEIDEQTQQTDSAIVMPNDTGGDINNSSVVSITR
ncbi:MAG: AI-2E family transporter [Chloroflexia bacterium]